MRLYMLVSKDTMSSIDAKDSFLFYFMRVWFSAMEGI